MNFVCALLLVTGKTSVLLHFFQTKDFDILTKCHFDKNLDIEKNVVVDLLLDFAT